MGGEGFKPLMNRCNQEKIDTILCEVGCQAGRVHNPGLHTGMRGFGTKLIAGVHSHRCKRGMSARLLVDTGVGDDVVDFGSRIKGEDGDANLTDEDDQVIFGTILPKILQLGETSHIAEVEDHVIEKPHGDGVDETPIEFSHNSTSFNLGGMPPFCGCKTPLGTFANIIIT